MSSRVPVIAGNWKMHKTISEAEEFTQIFLNLVKDVQGPEIVIGPPFTCLAAVSSIISGTGIRLAAQNMHFEQSGAFTGEISPPMLKEIGVDDVILGHSERREYNAENDSDLALKMAAALDSGIRPVLCVGESENEREENRTEEKLGGQLRSDLVNITESQLEGVVIAYEPIWAIGTGKTATPQIAQETIAFIRATLAEIFSRDAAEAVRILYGGSVKPDNISELMAEADIDGALVGGACLDPESFAGIVRFE